MTTAPEVRRRPGGRRVLTAVEFDVLWEWLGLGATPVVLRLDSPGRTHTERRGIVAAGWEGLRRRGLADLDGPDPEIVRLMHLLAVPTQQIELRMRLTRELRVVAAARSAGAALAVRQDATVVLTSAPGPVSALLGTLPTALAGPGRAVTLRSTVLDAVTAEPGPHPPIADLLVERGIAADDAELVESMLRGAHGRGQISVLAADRWGVLHRLRKVIGLVETRGGRYLMHRDTAPDGTEWTTLAPIDEPRLRHRLERLLAEAESLAVRG